ncbi:DUF885 family protein [Pseudactinotalea sp. HY160]|uniref:DUF885 domain-containing protein n=1 Tax=Pseudactinotalea sp. HY160 TaxID=2654490 RepID=UPI00128DC41B|nr:DUF885 domain-containing protein [Pseudactinotalea sp. HY160]MPV48559.1 DUF885 family protein [Pseudactinotalea sp. HY160]
MPVESRTSTPIDALCERFLLSLAELQPELRIYLGLAGDRTAFTDLSPAGREAERALFTRTRAELVGIEVKDEVDWVTKIELARDLGLRLEVLEAKWDQRDLNNLASPSQEIRQSFDLLPRATEEDWAVVAGRLAGVPGAMAGYLTTLREGIAEHNTPARRQAEIVAATLTDYLDGEGYFGRFIAPSAGLVGAGLRADLERGAAAATGAYAEFAQFLREELLPGATPNDGVGRDLYDLQLRRFLGATVELDETYEWGLAELARMRAEQEEIAGRIVPGGTVAEAIAHLDSDPARRLHGTRALREWMQATADEAIDALGREHFDIPAPVRTLECMIAPTTSGEIYYTPPSDDFSRPGQMWWAVPEGVTEFNTWREKTTVYHEGVPGHHLQLGQAVYNREQLNSWRRAAGTSGHAEGWALYAERLMDELGYLSDPGDRLGMLDGQRMRAARVVLDIGVHLGKVRPDGEGRWTYDYALEFMRENVNMDDKFVQFEVNRYFGWPGQAPSYKVGQRIFDELRADVQEVEGAGFDFKDYHRKILDMGGVGLDTLRAAVGRQVAGHRH